MATKKGTRKPSGDRLWPAKLGICSLRVYTGFTMLAAVHYKVFVPPGSLKDALVAFVELDYGPMIAGAIAEPPTAFGVEMTWYSRFLETVMTGGSAPYVFGAAILIFEGLLGISLLLGIGTRLMGLLGGLLMLAFAWAKRPDRPFYTLQISNYLLMMIMFALALMAAGRIWGLDAKLRHRLPGWIA